MNFLALENSHSSIHLAQGEILAATARPAPMPWPLPPEPTLREPPVGVHGQAAATWSEFCNGP